MAFGPPEAGGQVVAYEFARVDGHWYVSYSESSWSQGDPDYRDDEEFDESDESDIADGEADTDADADADAVRPV